MIRVLIAEDMHLIRGAVVALLALEEDDLPGHYDESLTDEWVAFVNRWYAPLRFAAHGLQMLAAYIAQLAPASRISDTPANATSFRRGSISGGHSPRRGTAPRSTRSASLRPR